MGKKIRNSGMITKAKTQCDTYRTAIEKSDVVIVKFERNTNNGMLLLTPVMPPHWANLS